MGFSARLEKALGADVRGLPETTLESLEALDILLTRWGKAVDLIGFKTQDERDRRYFAEALAALPWLPDEGRALDIGSGGGSPALPLAVARRTLEWTLVEANERKAVFLDEAARALQLGNVTVVQTRYEDLKPDASLDTVTVRGVALRDETLERIGVELAPSGRLLWFSSEARLKEARARLERSWARCTGPIPLVRNGGFLLVARAWS